MSRSIRRNKAGNLDSIQINGALNPGNSGGPVVDSNGRLVGVAVRTIPGAGIGSLVPGEDLVNLLAGRVLPPVFSSAGLEKEDGLFEVEVPVQDPHKYITTVNLYVLPSGDTPPDSEKPPAAGWTLMEGEYQPKSTLKIEDGKHVAKYRLPMKDKPKVGSCPGLVCERRWGDCSFPAQ